MKKICALLCSSLCLFGNGNIKAQDSTKNLQNCSTSNSSDAELGEFVSEELKRTEIEGNKESQFDAGTFFGNGALSSNKKEALRARGAQSVLKNNKVLEAFYSQDSERLREISKNRQHLSTALYALSWPSMLVALGVPLHDAVKGIRMQVIFGRWLERFKNMSEEDRKKLQKFYVDHGKNSIGYETYWANEYFFALRDACIGRWSLSGDKGEQLSWDKVKEGLKGINFDSQINFEEEMIKPVEKGMSIESFLNANK